MHGQQSTKKKFINFKRYTPYILIQNRNIWRLITEYSNCKVLYSLLKLGFKYFKY